MSILSVAQKVAKKIGINIPTSLFQNAARTETELLDCITDAASFIASGYDWQVLLAIHTLQGDGAMEAFPAPVDYSRMLVKSKLWASDTVGPIEAVYDQDSWLGMLVSDTNGVTRAWTIYGGQVHVLPVMETTVNAKFFYVTDQIWKDSVGATKAEATNDNDIFRINEKLLEFCTIWRWKAGKGQAYVEAMADYDQLLARLVARDRGSRMIRVGRPIVPSDVEIAYPWEVPH